MESKILWTALAVILANMSAAPSAAASDNGVVVDRTSYANRPLLADFSAKDCPDDPRGLDQVRGNLYRHTTGAGLAVHSGLVLITRGAGR